MMTDESTNADTDMSGSARWDAPRDVPHWTPTPEARRRVANPQGVPLAMADGRTWVLAHGALAPTLLPEIDKIFDQQIITGTIPLGPALQVVGRLLVANYELTNEEIVRLLDGVADEAVVQAACEALFGPPVPRRTWSTWALSSLYANNIEPSTVPPWLLRDVLHQLVQTGRAMGQSAYIDSCAAVKARADLFASLDRGGVARPRHPDDPTRPPPAGPGQEQEQEQEHDHGLETDGNPLE